MDKDLEKALLELDQSFRAKGMRLGVETLLTEEEVERLNRNGGDGWKTANVVIGNLEFYRTYEGLFKYHKLPYETFKKITLTALLTPMDILGLWKEVQAIPEKGVYLEIGSFVGGSLVLVDMARQDLSITSIDPHTHNDRNHIERGITSAQVYEENTKDISKTYYRENSVVACPRIPQESVDLLFVDGGHLYEEAKLDLLNYWPKVKVGGVMLVHDYSPEGFPGVVKAVDEVFKGSFTRVEDSTLVRIVNGQPI